MGRATSKGNEAKSEMKHPSDMTTPRFELKWWWAIVDPTRYQLDHRDAREAIVVPDLYFLKSSLNLDGMYECSSFERCEWEACVTSKNRSYISRREEKSIINNSMIGWFVFR